MDDTDSLNIRDDWEQQAPRRWMLLRRTDVNDYSGTGIVAWGVMFEDGACTMRWCVDGKPKTTTDYATVEDVEDIHGHDGATSVIFIDYPPVRVHNGIPV